MEKPNKTANNLLKDLTSPRAQEIISRRFGIGKFNKRETLEAIGQSHGITRERVRQIEFSAINRMHSMESDEIKKIFADLNDEINKRGGLVREDNFLREMSSDNDKDANYFNFFLTLGDDFKKIRENDDFHNCWTNDSTRADNVHQAVSRLAKSISIEALLSEDEITDNLMNGLSGFGQNISKESLISLLNTSRKIGKNNLGEWGRVESPQISPRGVRDLASLVLRKTGKPMHFTEITTSIKSMLNKSAHLQTVHNELIRDPQFVLVGRGLYALTSMGYKNGVVADVIKQILKDESSLTSREIVKKVLDARYVKESTILINLQNKNSFKKLSDGKYTLV